MDIARVLKGGMVSSDTDILNLRFMLQSLRMLFVDYTMTNIKNICLIKSLGSVPTSKIWGGLKSVGSSDVILNGNKKPRPEWRGFCVVNLVNTWSTNCRKYLLLSLCLHVSPK